MLCVWNTHINHQWMMSVGLTFSSLLQHWAGGARGGWGGGVKLCCPAASRGWSITVDRSLFFSMVRMNSGLLAEREKLLHARALAPGPQPPPQPLCPRFNQAAAGWDDDGLHLLVKYHLTRPYRTLCLSTEQSKFFSLWVKPLSVNSVMQRTTTTTTTTTNKWGSIWPFFVNSWCTSMWGPEVRGSGYTC